MPKPPLLHVRSAAREVFDPALFRESLRIRPADATVAAAVRAGLAPGIVLTAFAAAGRTDLAAFAALGALTALFGRYDTYRRRATLLAVVGALLTGAMGLFTLLAALGAPTAVTVVAMALLAAGTTAFVLLLRTGPPGATIVVFCAGAGVAGSPGLADLAPRTLAGLAGAAVAWAVCMAPALLRPTAPARLAVRRALRAVEVARGSRTLQDRAAAAGTVDAARDALADDASWRRTRPTALALAAELETGAGRPLGPLPAWRPLRA